MNCIFVSVRANCIGPIALCLLMYLAARPLAAQDAGMPSLPRLMVLTDISAFTDAEPDDSQSMIRLMLYTNELEIEGLIATSNMGHGQRTRPELIRKIVDAYANVRANLILHDGNYPPAEVLAARIKAGQPVAGPGVPVDQCVGEGKDTEGSEWIIQVVDKADPRPVWLAIWGGSTDLAQALWKVRATRTPGEVNEFIGKLRVHFVYDQDTTGPWIRSQFPGLHCVRRHHGIRGMYRGGDTTLVRSRWVETNIRHGHGALGALYTNYNGGDIWTRKLGRVRGIKEGDSPSFLGLLRNGLNVPGHPELASWGGRFVRDSVRENMWVEATDRFPGNGDDPDPRMAAVYRWRPGWQADFAARLDWCVMSFREANHAPRRQTAAKKNWVVRAGAKVTVFAPEYADPDGDRLSCKWYFYPEEGTYHGAYPTLGANASKASFTAPVVTSPQTLHIILEVADDGEPSLTAYERFVVTVNPK